MTTDALFGSAQGRVCPNCHARRAPRTGHRAIAPGECLVTGVELVPVDGCAECGGPLESYGAAQLPLLRHGGYGAVTSHRSATCAQCGWQGPQSQTTESPR